MSPTMFLNAAKSAHVLIDGGLSQDEAISHLVAMKGGAFTMQFDGSTYFDPRELQRIVKSRGEKS